MPFNFTRKYDFLLNFTLDSKLIDVTYKTKILGVIMTSYCNFEENMKYIVLKGK